MDTSYRQFIETADRYLRGSMDNADREAFESRLATDAEFRQAFGQHAAMTEGLQRAFFKEKVETQIQKLQTAEPPKRRPWRGRRLLWGLLAGVAFFALYIALNAPWWSPAPDKQQQSPKQQPKTERQEPIAYTPDGREPAVGAGQDYPYLLPETVVRIREIRMQNGAYKGSTYPGQRWQLSVRQRAGQSPAYRLSGDTLRVLMPALSARPDAALALVSGEKTWYLRLDNRWYRVAPSDGEMPLTPESDPKRLDLLNQF